ncbi:hypothetical protein [Aestuariibius sp. HNIBRBA575]|uniref:hypothetical protein n=1 Tax=Aestuariibius sp. HNIBRBA575 TaxID=3233343 RepID=UPI0034A57884
MTAKRPLAVNTLARIARGMKRYVLDAERPFLVNMTQGGQVAPSITRFNSGATGHAITDPMATVTANSFIKRPGGAAPIGLLAPALATYYGHTGNRGKRSANVLEPLRTVTTENRHAVIAPSLMSLKGTSRRSSSAVEPHPTILAGGFHSALIAPHVATMRNAQKPFSHADEPTHTITAGGAGLYVAAPVLTYAQQGGSNRSVTDPHHTICANSKDQNAVIIPTIVGCGGRAAQSRPRGGPEPLATITAKADSCAATAFLAQHNTARKGVNPGRSLEQPASTVTGTGSQQGVIASWFAKYYGTGDGALTDDPMHTVTVKDRFGHMQADIQAPPFTPEMESRAREVADFLRAHDAWDGGEFVTLEIDGETYVIADIGMRMLTPRELFNAQGFPSDYVIEGVWNHEAETDKWTWNPFTKATQVSCCGNSVCPDMGAALVGANCAHLKVNADQEAAHG